MIESIRPNLHVFYSPGQGSNAYVLIGKKIALIDASSSANAGQILSGLKSLDIAPENIDQILFTHGHADHFGCSALFPKAEKRMHLADAEHLAVKDTNFTFSDALGEKTIPRIDSHFKESDLIELKPFSLKVLGTPGHTPGSVCFFDEKQGLLFSGDTLFQGSCGRTDLPCGSDSDLIESLEKISKLPYSLLLPGHGLVLKENQKENVSEVLKTLKRQYI